MPELDEKVLLAEAKKDKEDTKVLVEERIYGKRKAWVGAGGVIYSSYGEALQSIQKEEEKKRFDDLGLNENGQTPAQEAFSKERVKLLKERDEKMKEVLEIEGKLQSLKVEDFVEKKGKKSGKK